MTDRDIGGRGYYRIPPPGEDVYDRMLKRMEMALRRMDELGYSPERQARLRTRAEAWKDRIRVQKGLFGKGGLKGGGE